MKKVININFQGRVVPIEETAYEILKQYVESLRKYFASEEGRDEIINDIESRIAELFSERLKKGSTCITDDDVNDVIAGMGRPEDFEAAENEPVSGATNNSKSTNSGSSQQSSSQQSGSQSYGYSNTYAGRGRLYRNADDKLIAGVASGLANYFAIDPVVMRIVFVLLFAPLFWVYVILWVIIPSKSIQSNITKRLYRSSEDKVIAGVCGGLASYFNISTWVPRLIFALPLIIGLISGPFNWWWNDFDFFWVGPKIITGSLGSTLFITYIILWIAVPVAVTAAEKLEMRGEKVDLNSIRNTVKEDLESFKSKAQNWGSEVKQTAQTLGQSAYGQSKTFASEAGTVARGAGSGIGHVIGVLFKAFFLFIAGVIALALFGVLLGLLFGGFAIFPLKSFVLEGFWQNTLAWLSLLLFLGVPLISLTIWLIRRIMGVRSRSHYLGYVFGTLWIIGIVSTVLLIGFVGRNFKTRSAISEDINLAQPKSGKLYMDVQSNNIRYYGSDWFGIDYDDDWPFYGVNQDTLMLNTVRVDIVKSKDSAYHAAVIKFSRGNNPDEARRLAQKISFGVTQMDSMLLLPKGFAISQAEKFRNQQVMVIVEVPVGKRIQLDRSVGRYDWFDVRYNRRGGFDFDDNWDRTYWINSGREYIMTPDGPEEVDKLDPKELKKGHFKLKIRNGEVDVDIQGEVKDNTDTSTGDYRYRRNNEKPNKTNKKDSTTIKDSVTTTTKIKNIVNDKESLAATSSSRVTDVTTPLSTIGKFL